MSTSAQLTEVRFSERRRGYDPDQVDNYLEKVGEKVFELQKQLREATDRIDAAEARAAEADERAQTAEARAAEVGQRPAPVPAPDPQAVEAANESVIELEETLKHTMVTAQRAADQLVKEAEAQAEKLVAEARARAEATVRETAVGCKAKLAEAESEARRKVDEATGTIKGQLTVLEDRKRQLSNEIDRLERQVDAQRSIVEEVIADLRAVLSHGAASGSPVPPRRALDLLDVGRAPSLPDRPARPERKPSTEARERAKALTERLESGPRSPRPTIVPRPATAPAAPTPPTPEQSADQADEPAPILEAMPEPTPAAEPSSDAATDAGAATDATRVADEPMAAPREAAVEVEPLRNDVSPSARTPSFKPHQDEPAPDAKPAGPPTAPVAVTAEAPESTTVWKPADDSFLDELRRAVADEPSTSDDDEQSDESAMEAFFDQPDRPKRRGRFGRKP
jgi:cell division initiation protein